MGRCNDCGECVLHCPHEALSLSAGKVWWQSDVCQQCDTCLHMCPQQATPMAQSMSVDEVLQHIRKAVLFIEELRSAAVKRQPSCRLLWRYLPR